MPELPELEVIREVLERRLVGRRIQSVIVSPKGGPILIRDLTGSGFAAVLEGKKVAGVIRRGKFLLFTLTPGEFTLAINPKLSGRLQLCEPNARKAGPVHITFHFHDTEQELRYIDRKQMGQIYLTTDPEAIPGFEGMGPEALDVSLEEFQEGLMSFRGEIKGILVRGRLVAGIGNAYADEILWAARLHPYRKRPSLTEEEIRRLYLGMRGTLLESLDKVREAMGEATHLKPREFFAVHLRGGEPCPRCGTGISAITANQRITNFCRACQPGGLIRGMEQGRRS